jgi:hypothetical protein
MNMRKTIIILSILTMASFASAGFNEDFRASVELFDSGTWLNQENALAARASLEALLVAYPGANDQKKAEVESLIAQTYQRVGDQATALTHYRSVTNLVGCPLISKAEAVLAIGSIQRLLGDHASATNTLRQWQLTYTNETSVVPFDKLSATFFLSISDKALGVSKAIVQSELRAAVLAYVPELPTITLGVFNPNKPRDKDTVWGNLTFGHLTTSQKNAFLLELIRSVNPTEDSEAFLAHLRAGLPTQAELEAEEDL